MDMHLYKNLMGKFLFQMFVPWCAKNILYFYLNAEVEKVFFQEMFCVSSSNAGKRCMGPQYH